MSAAREDTLRPFSVDVEPERDAVRVCPHGDVDLATVGVLREHVDELTAAGFVHVLLDLRGVTFLDSTGLRLVLELYRASRADGWDLTVIEGPAEAQRVFDVTGLRPLLPLVDGSGRGNGHWRRAWG
jgi:anti-sigma B factor antagonist